MVEAIIHLPRSDLAQLKLELVAPPQQELNEDCDHLTSLGFLNQEAQEQRPAGFKWKDPVKLVESLSLLRIVVVLVGVEPEPKCCLRIQDRVLPLKADQILGESRVESLPYPTQECTAVCVF